MATKTKVIAKYFIAILSIVLFFAAVICVNTNINKTQPQTESSSIVNNLTLNSGFTDNQYVVINGKAYSYMLSSTTQSSEYTNSIQFSSNNTLELIFLKDSITQLSTFYLSDENIASVLQATKTQQGINISILYNNNTASIETSYDAEYKLGTQTLNTNNILNYANQEFTIGTTKGSTSLLDASTSTNAKILNLTGGTFQLKNTTYTGNGTGRAIAQSGGTLTLNSIKLTGFSSTDNGGAIYSTGGTLTITGGEYTGNSTSKQGGAIYSTGTLTISSATISNNTAATGGGGLAKSGGTATLTSATMENNITTSAYGHAFWANGGAVITVNSGTYSTQDSSYKAATVIAGNATVNLVGGTFKGYNYAFDCYSANGANAKYVLKGNPTIEATSGNHFWLNVDTYLRIETTLTNTYTVLKNGLTSFDDGDAATSYIAYSTDSTYLSSATSKLTVTNYQTYHQHSTDIKTNYLVCEYKSYNVTFHPNGGYRVSDSNSNPVTIPYDYGHEERISERARTGYTLTGYTVTDTDGGSNIGGATTTFDSTKKTGSVKVGYADIIVKMDWTPNVYKVTLNNQSATSAGTLEYYYQYNTSKVINNITCYYYTTSACTTGLTNGYYITCPTKTGYTFGGYYTGQNGAGTQYVNASGSCVNNLFQNVASDSTLYARWTPNLYKVTLDNQSATTAGTAEYYYQYNTTKVIGGVTCYYYTTSACTTGLKDGYYITCPTKTGYTFGGYYTSTNGGGTQYVNASGSCVGNLFQNVASNSTLYAKWTANTYTVSYNANGGSGTMANTTVTYNSSYTAPACTFTRTGYTFTHWTEAATGGVSWDGWIGKAWTWTYTKNITLYAQWKINTYTLHIFKGQEQLLSAAELAKSSTSNGNNCTVTYSPTNGGTWTSSPKNTTDPYATITQTLSLTADTTYYFHMTIRNPDGSVPSGSIQLFIGPNGSYSEANSVRFYNGGGYASFKAPSTATYRLRLDNDFSGKEVVVTNFWGSSAAATNYETVSVNYAATYDIGSVSRTGYAFDSWTVATGAYSINKINTAITGIATLNGTTITMGAGDAYVYASYDLNTYNISIGVNNSSYGTVSSSSVTAYYGSAVSTSGTTLTIGGNIITASATALTGYTTTLSSWTNATDSITVARTITANFTRTINTYTVTITRNQTSYGTVSSSEVIVPYGTTYSTNGTTLTIGSTTITATPTAVTGYTTTFSSWSSTSGTITSNISIMANFARRENIYTVSFVYGNDLQNETLSVAYGTVFNVGAPTKTGYTFAGWNITGMDTCTHYYGTSSSSMSTSTASTLTNNKATLYKNLRATSGTVTFTATWSIVKYTVTINYNDWDLTESETKTVYCNEWFEIPIPTTDYYIFCGWQITGMDGGTHYYGTSTSLFSTTTASSISETKSTHFKNLRVTDGAVSIDAVWVASERTVTYKFGGNVGWFDVYDNINYEQITPWPTTFIYEGPSSDDYSARFRLDKHSYRTMGSTIVSETDWYSITADPFDGYSIIDAYIYNVDTGDGFYVTDTMKWESEDSYEMELTHNLEITFIVETKTPLNVTLVIDNASEYSAYFNHNSALPDSPYTIQVAFGTQITTNQSMISFGSDSIFVIASGGTVDYWSVASDTIVISDMTITVYLTQPKYTVTIVVNSSSLGTVNTSVINNVAYGTRYSSSGSILTVGSTTVTALPKKTSSGFATFSSWSPSSGIITSDTTITAIFSTPGGMIPFASLQEPEFTIDENNAPNGAEIWLDDKFRKLQEQQDTIVDFEGVSF